ncbi:hypothetical protein [Streptomyces similanensis]|uniref:Bacterial transcriptional activator domain-containing protein n=1 Tax=Streptomyces similanensis TaxID=1274988 RepID=A0ABP9LM62_9ACTN
MRTTTRSPAAVLARVFKAVLSLHVLAAAVIGLPVLLAWATPVIWAASYDDLGHLLDRQDTGAAFLLLLVAVGWIGWAQFSFCAVRELVAQLRGHRWQAARGLGASQRAAALLIGSILVLLPASSALASNAQAAPAASAGRVPGHAATADALQDGAGAGPSLSTRFTPSPTYTVRDTRPAENLWGIAERELEDGERWREIVHLNDGRAMTDGTIFHASSFLQPGWKLLMPQSGPAAGGRRAQLETNAAATGDTDAHVTTVHSGDSLSKIAEEELGDGENWPRLFEASRGKPQPHGLPAITDPDVIYTGQQITVPEARPDRTPHSRSEAPGGQETTPPASHTPHGAKKPGGSTSEKPTATPATRQAAPPTPYPSASAGVSVPSAPAERPERDGSSPSTSPEVSGPAGVSAAPQAPAASPADNPLNLRIVLGAGALLAASVTGALALRRTLQRRRRRPGETIAIAAKTSSAEAQLAAAAEPGGAARLDVALRTLAHHVAQQQKEEAAALPRLRAARIATRALEVLPEDLTQEPVVPFTAGRPGWWTLPAEAVLLDDEAARDVPAPYPGLVTIGTTETGDLLLLNLAGLPALLLDGNPVHITEVCTSIALELGMSPWAADVEVVTVGFGEDLPHLLPTARIAHMRQTAHALRDLGERLLEAHQMPETQHQPYLMLCAAALDEDTAWQFADLIDRASTVPVTLIAPASTAAAHFPEAEIINASLTKPQPLDHVGTDITVQRLEHAAYQQITAALTVSGQPSHPAEGLWQDIPDEPDTTPQPERAAPETAAPTALVSITSATATTDVSSEVFPALLAADTDPSGLRLPSPTAASARPDGQTGPDTTAAAPADGAEQDSSGAAETPKTDTPATAALEAREAQDPHAPEIRVLGPVEVTGVNSTGHGPRMAQLAALLYFRPGRNADALCADMDPVSPWSTSTLNARIQGLRSSLGSDPCGNPYVPRRKSGEDPYRLTPAVRCDWTRFLQLVERALPLGPPGLPDLEKALSLVRGRPFGGRPLPWAEPCQQEMITRIIDVAHTVATYRTPAGPHHDLHAARQAVAIGLEVDETAELLYRAWMRLEAARGNRSGLHTAITRVQQVNHELDCSLEPETTELINKLLHSSNTAARTAQSPKPHVRHRHDTAS